MGIAAIVLAALPALSYGQASSLQKKEVLGKARASIDKASTINYDTDSLEQWLKHQQRRKLKVDSGRAKLPLATKEGVNLDALMDRYNKTNFTREGLNSDMYPNVLVLVSLGMPDSALIPLLKDASTTGARVIIRGMVAGGDLKATAMRIRKLINHAGGGQIDIDPLPFRTFNVTRVPTFIVTKTSYRDCRGIECKGTIPLFDKIVGNISLRSALETVSLRGDVKGVAKRYLQPLERLP